ncbi:P-loop NTPase fold protein [Ketobacter sp.]|uniref:KAP family P-loop NTPase fold protein n=1 Tax=Ketobacter sp. TaxID=2083498 RepID=UPI0025C2164A|nr:P-loop NTPase fold protein [Ketobacter sp.]
MSAPPEDKGHTRPIPTRSTKTHFTDSTTDSTVEPIPVPAYLPSRRQSAERISDQDRLNRSRLVEALATVLTGDNDHHQTIGLLGDWGVGKSTTVHLLKQALWQRRRQQPFIFGTFNAWEYEHTDNLQAGMAQEMLKALTSFPQAPDTGFRAGWRPLLWWCGVRLPLLFRFAVALHGPRLLLLAVLLLLALWNLSWQDLENMASATMAAGAGAQVMVGGGALVLVVMLLRQAKALLAMPLAKEWMTYLKLPDYGQHLGSIPVMRKHIHTLCKVRLNPWFGPRQRLLFLVDDLDRCGQEGIVKVFEAVRLVLDIPQVTVIIAVDQRIALAALALHYEALAEHHELSHPQAIARDYLAKVIHMPITLTPADARSIDAFLESIWEETAGGPRPGTPVTPESPAPPAGAAVGLSDAQKKLFKRWVQHFGFTNPRQLKRLHNSYNLLRHYYGDEGRVSGGESSLLDGFTSDLGSPMLITLFALEYIHSLEHAELRGRLLQRVNQARERSFQEEGDEAVADADPQGRITADVLQVITGKLNQEVSLVQAVQPFVLPSIVQEHAGEPETPTVESR